MARKSLDPKARLALNQLKEEISKELGIQSSSHQYRSNTTSRSNGQLGGQLGGHMTKRLIEMAERSLSD